MHPAIIIGTVRLLWTWLWGRYHVPQNERISSFLEIYSECCFLISKQSLISGISLWYLIRMRFNIYSRADWSQLSVYMYCWFYVLATCKRLFEPFVFVLINKIMVSMTPTWICRFFVVIGACLVLYLYLHFFCTDDVFSFYRAACNADAV